MYSCCDQVDYNIDSDHIISAFAYAKVIYISVYVQLMPS